MGVMVARRRLRALKIGGPHADSGRSKAIVLETHRCPFRTLAIVGNYNLQDNDVGAVCAGVFTARGALLMQSSLTADSLAVRQMSMGVFLERRAFMAYACSSGDVTAKDFVATTLEAEAAKMPTSMKEKADVLRNAAKIYREHGSKQKIRVLEEGQEEKFLID